MKPGVAAEIAMLSRQFHKIYIENETFLELFDIWVCVLYADVDFFFPLSSGEIMFIILSIIWKFLVSTIQESRQGQGNSALKFCIEVTESV